MIRAHFENGILALSGRLGFATVAQALKLLEGEVPKHVVKGIDCHAMGHCDSTGLLLLLGIYRLLGQAVPIINVPPKLEKLIRLSDLEGIFITAYA